VLFSKLVVNKGPTKFVVLITCN